MNKLITPAKKLTPVNYKAGTYWREPELDNHYILIENPFSTGWVAINIVNGNYWAFIEKTPKEAVKGLIPVGDVEITLKY